MQSLLYQNIWFRKTFSRDFGRLLPKLLLFYTKSSELCSLLKFTLLYLLRHLFGKKACCRFCQFQFYIAHLNARLFRTNDNGTNRIALHNNRS